MSANDAKSSGEVDLDLNAVGDSPNFESPNISNLADEEQEKIDEAAAERKKAETVDIDGIPIDEKEVKFKAADIKKKGKTEYFVNVEGAEERKREKERRAREEAAEAKREAEEAAKEAEQKAHAAKLAADKKAMEARKKATAEDNRVIGELKQKAAQRKKEIRRAKRQVRRKKTLELLFKGGHKFITLGIILAIAALVVWLVVIPIDNDIRRKRDEEIAKEEEKAAEERMKNDESLIIEPILSEADEYLEVFDLDSADKLYEEALSKVSTDKLRSRIYLRRSKTVAMLMYDLEPNRVYEDARKAYELDPDSYDATWWLADVYERRGEKDRSDSLRKKLETLMPDDSEVDDSGSEWGEG